MSELLKERVENLHVQITLEELGVKIGLLKFPCRAFSSSLCSLKTLRHQCHPLPPCLVGGCKFPVVVQSLCGREVRGDVGQKGNLYELSMMQDSGVHLQQLSNVHGKQSCVVEHLIGRE